MQFKTTLDTLSDMGFEKPYLVVMNKCEKVSDRTAYPKDCIFVSAKEDIGLDLLKKKILNYFRQSTLQIRLKIPYEQMAAYGKLKKYVVEKSFKYGNDALYVNAVVESSLIDYFKDFIV